MGNTDSSQHNNTNRRHQSSTVSIRNVVEGDEGREDSGPVEANIDPSSTFQQSEAANASSEDDGNDLDTTRNRPKRQRTGSPSNMTPGNDEVVDGGDGVGGGGQVEARDSIENIENQLAEVEEGLTQQRGALFESSQDRQQAGQAMFDSIGTALGSIRSRLQGLSSSFSRGTDDTTTTSPSSGEGTEGTNAAVASSSIAAAASLSTAAVADPASQRRRSSVSDLSQRLHTAERAYSMRMPLGILQDQSSHNSAPAQGEPPMSSGRRSISADSPLKDDGSMQSDSMSDDEAGMRQQRRRTSVLVASRRRSDIHDRRELEMHESVVGIGARPTTILETRESDLSIDTSNKDDNAKVETDAKDNDDVQGVEVELLLPESTREQLGAVENHMQLTSSLKVLSHSSSRNLFSSSDAVAEHDVVMDSSDNAEKEVVSPSERPLASNKTPLYTWGSIEFDIVDDGTETSKPSKGTYTLFGTKAKEGEGEKQVLSPKLIPPDTRLGNSDIISASISGTHMAFCTDTGRILGCGDNTNGALDPSQRSFMPTIPRPTHLEVLAMQRVCVVACGRNHTAAITENRSVLTFGSNDKGQLGHRLPPSSSSSSTASQVRSPAMMQFKGRASDVKCGDGFTLVLTTRMQVFMCGREEIRSGLNAAASDSNGRRLPEEHPALMGLPLVFIAAGDSHCVVVTAHGTCYAWGKNENGECGRPFPTSVKVPSPFIMPTTSLTVSNRSSTIRNWEFWDENMPISLADDVNITHAACGANHTVLVTKTGRLLVCGSNSKGQLGLPSSDFPNFTSAKEVMPPSPERKFISAEAGSNHTLLLDEIGGVYYLGSASGGIQEVSTTDLPAAQQVVAGGSANLIFGKREQTSSSLPTKIQTASGLDELLEAIRVEHDESFQDTSSTSSGRSLAEDLCDRSQELFKNPGVMNSLFMDPLEIENLYQRLITGGHNREVRQKIVAAMEQGMIQALESMSDARLMYPESVRFLLLFLQCPLLRESKLDSDQDGDDDAKDTPGRLQFDERGEMLLLLCETILALPLEGYKSFIGWAVSVYGPDRFVPFLVKPLIVQLNTRIQQERTTMAVPAIAGVLRWFETAADHSEVKLALPEDFYCNGIEELPMESLYEDLYRYSTSSKIDRANRFFLAANSFLFSPQLKRNLLQIENQLTMVHAAQAGGVHFDPRTREFEFQPYFVLSLDRQYLLQQTLQKVAQASPSDLRKGLKIVFKGEDGVDAGGVTREFFMLLVQQLFDVNTGMWTTRLGDGSDTWFNSDCTWNDDGYYLTGVLVGLALYNGVLLDVHFPQAVYRKLLGLPLGLEDMVDEDVRKGLQQLLDYDGDDVEDIFW
mmetsp:Transcript_7395/g.18172  ORF Transcript_7395/g.18172 Transcript_7395/m.18172 type:complete len:1339 (-) Transcript_7395:2813-6829(-)